MAPNQRKQTNIDVALATRPINETLDLRFADNVRRNLFPSTFQSYDELLSYLNLLHSEGKSKAEIEEAVGIKTGRDFSYAKSGGFSLNTRKMAELVPLGLIDHIKKQEAAGIFPPGTAKQYLDDVHRTWNESSKRTQKIAETTAGYWDNGHWIAAKDPKNLGPTTGRNANPEPQKSFIGADGVPIQGNAVHQEMPRANINQAGLDALGIPKNWFEDFYEFVMRDPKLNRSGTNMGSGLGRSMTDAEAMRVNVGYVNPQQLAAQVDKQTQLAAQGVSLGGVNPNDTMAGPVTQVKAPLFPEFSRGQAPKGLMPNRAALTAMAADVANRETAPSIDPELVSEFSSSQSRGQNIGGYLPIPIPTGSQLKQLAPSIKAQLPFAASSAIEPLQRGEPTRALEEVAKGTAIGMATDPIVKPIMSRLIPAVGSVAVAAPVATTAAAAVASELAAPRAAQGGPERVTVNGTPYWLDKKSNKVYTNDGRPTSFGIDIKGGKPQLVPRGQGAGTKRAEADPIRQAMQGNLMPALNRLNPMSQLLRFSNSAMKTIRGEV